MMMIWIRDDVDIDWPTDDDMFFQRFWVLLLLLLRRLEVVVVVFFFVFFFPNRPSVARSVGVTSDVFPTSFLLLHSPDTLNPKKNIPNLPSNFPP